MMVLDPYRYPAGGFDPETDITWHSLFWAEGTDFATEGYSGDITADGQWSAFQSWASTHYGVTL